MLCVTNSLRVGRILLVALACAKLAGAQSATTGALAGTVLDFAGMLLPGVTVTLMNRATNQTLTATTDKGGNYRFSLLPPGNYGVTFSVTGYKPAQMPALAVNAAEAPTVEVRLEPGQAAEPQMCQCRVSLTTASSGTMVDQKTITSVPLNTRNFTQVLSMSSGSAADVNNAGILGRGTQSVNISGNTTAATYTIDGAYAPSTVPNPDTIAGFKIQTSQYDASYGAQAPSTNLIMRSGENAIHGTLWEFARNDIFNANEFFRNSTGQRKPNLKQHQFGAALGGKVIRNKLFYFGSFQGTRQGNGLDPTSVANLLLPALTNDRSPLTLAAQLCPANHPSAAARYQTFAGGKQLDCANQNTATTAPINPIALRILQTRRPDGSYLIPVPQTIVTSGANAGLGFSSFSYPSTYNENQFMLNTDYIVAANQTLAARGFYSSIDQYRSFGSPSSNTGIPLLPDVGAPQFLHGTDLAASLKLTSTLTKNLVNEARASVTISKTNTNGIGTPTASSLGITAVDPYFALAPAMVVLGPLGSFQAFGGGPNDNFVRTRTYVWADNLSWTRGKHSLRTGGIFLRQANGRRDIGGARGKITFQTFSDFLLGLSAADNLSPAGRGNIQSIQASEGIGPNGEVQYLYRNYYGSLFVQDDIKIASGFTIYPGIRWEYVGPSLDTAGAIGNVWPSLLGQLPIPPASGTLIGNTVAANYDPGLINPYTGRPFGPPPAGVFVRGSSSFYENSTPLKSFSPRFGFAWQPFGTQGRLSVRGGYGLFYQTPTFSGNAANAPLFTSAPFAQGFTNTDVSNSASNLAKPFPATTLGYVLRTPTSQLSDRVAGPAYRVPQLQQWSVNAQYRLARNYTLDVGYVGSYGNHLLISHGLNQPLLASATNPVNCGYTGVSADCITTNTSLNAKFRVPVLGETPTALAASEYSGVSTYRSFQATLRKQLSRGVTFQAAYTLSRAENNAVIYNDQNDLQASRAPASFNRTQRLIANFDYQLPTLAHVNGFTGALANGWSLAGIAIVQTGTPMTLTDPAGGAVYGRAGTSTVTLCPGITGGDLATSGGETERLGHWINTTGVCAPAVIGGGGASGYGNSQPGIVIGPGQFNTDISLGKTTRVGGLREDAVLAFRVEFYNAMNHPMFSNPGTTLGTANFGVVTQTSVAPRLIQFGMKYLF